MSDNPLDSSRKGSLRNGIGVGLEGVFDCTAVITQWFERRQDALEKGRVYGQFVKVVFASCVLELYHKSFGSLGTDTGDRCDSLEVNRSDGILEDVGIHTRDMKSRFWTDTVQLEHRLKDILLLKGIKRIVGNGLIGIIDMWIQKPRALHLYSAILCLYSSMRVAKKTRAAVDLTRSLDSVEHDQEG